MADKKNDSKPAIAQEDTTAEIHLPPAQYETFKNLLALWGQKKFDDDLVKMVFPESERFGLDHVRLIKKMGPSVPTQAKSPQYTKTCSST
jgi:hypothetical protein